MQYILLSILWIIAGALGLLLLAKTKEIGGLPVPFKKGNPIRLSLLILAAGPIALIISSMFLCEELMEKS